MNKLYEYVHCPYCIRVKMACGYLKFPYIPVVLPYNDEQTPISLIGKKMLPIMKFADGSICNESLEIIEKIDPEDILQTKKLTNTNNLSTLDNTLSLYGKDIHSLAMPYWIYTKEFTAESRDYFVRKKEQKRGPFRELYLNKDKFEKNILEHIMSLEKNLVPYYNNNQLTIMDIMIASHFWGTYVVPEFRSPSFFHFYLQRIKKECNFEYHHDLWV